MFGISIGGSDGIFGRPVEVLMDADMMKLHERLVASQSDKF